MHKAMKGARHRARLRVLRAIHRRLPCHPVGLIFLTRTALRTPSWDGTPWGLRGPDAKAAIIIADVARTHRCSPGRAQLIPDEVYEAAKIAMPGVTSSPACHWSSSALVSRGLPRPGRLCVCSTCPGHRLQRVENSRWSRTRAPTAPWQCRGPCPHPVPVCSSSRVAFLKITNTGISGNDEARRAQ